MNHLECPSREVWESRRKWFEAANDEACIGGCYLLSEQACALSAEVQSVFCAGAWAAVIVLAMAVVDAQLRETEVPGFDGNTARLIDASGAAPELHQLRQRRNALVHVDPESPAITVDQQWAAREALEREARAAVRFMFRAFYMSPAV